MTVLGYTIYDILQTLIPISQLGFSIPRMENPDWLVGIRVCKTLQIACSRTVIYLTKLHKKLLAILLYAYGAGERQQGSKAARQQGSKVSV